MVPGQVQEGKEDAGQEIKEGGGEAQRSRQGGPGYGQVRIFIRVPKGEVDLGLGVGLS